MQQKLYIEETNETPFVHFNPAENIFEFTGRSLPEDVNKFYTPVREWVTEYVKNPNPETVLTFNLDYFNSSSARVIVKILVALESIPETGNKIKVVWLYKEGDELMYDRGDEIKSVILLPFELKTF